MLTYDDLVSGRKPTKQEADGWDAEVRRIREAWEAGRERHARRNSPANLNARRMFAKRSFY